MPITSTIDETVPDGATQTVSVLDNTQRQHKIDIRERLEDGLIDNAIAAWNNTTTKEFQEGTARVYVQAAAPATRLHEGKVWIDSSPTAVGTAFQYYDGAAFADVPIATANLINAVVTTAKLAAVSIFTVHANLTHNASTALPAGYAQLGLLTTGAFTPASANSAILAIFSGTVLITAGGDQGQIRLQQVDAASTVATLGEGRFRGSGTNDQGVIVAAGLLTGEATQHEIEVQGNSIIGTVTLRGDLDLASFTCVELRLP